MSNLTLTIGDQVLKRARMRALDEGTSVNAIVREFLEQYVGADPGASALQSFLAAAQKSTAGSGAEGRYWTREDLYRTRLDDRGA